MLMLLLYEFNSERIVATNVDSLWQLMNLIQFNSIYKACPVSQLITKNIGVCVCVWKLKT